MHEPHPLLPLLGRVADPEQVRHVRELPGREAETAAWPETIHPDVVAAYGAMGIDKPYAHQARAIRAAGESHVIVATGTASGKSLAYQAPVLSDLHRGRMAARRAPGQRTEAVLKAVSNWVVLGRCGIGWSMLTSLWDSFR